MFGILEVEKVIEKEQKRGQRGRELPIGLIACAAAPFLGEIAKPIFKIFFGGIRKSRR